MLIAICIILVAIQFVYWRHNKPLLAPSVLTRNLLGIAALLVFMLGMLRFEISQKDFDAGDLAFYNDRQSWVEVIGLIADPPIKKDGFTELRIQAESLEIPIYSDKIFIEGGLLVRTNDEVDWAYGDRVLIRGKLEYALEFEDFSYRSYLARQGIDSLISFAEVIQLEVGQGNSFLTALFLIRAQALQKLKALYPEPESALLSGILLGEESGLSNSLKEDFNVTGARHIIAISGFNITIIAGIFISLFRRLLGPHRGTWLAIFGIAIYTLLVGADAPVVRAAIMGTFALLARQTGRYQAGLVALSLSAALMALANPHILWDVGFQLSFVATLGLILYADRLANGAEKLIAKLFNQKLAIRIRSPLSEFFLLTIAAQITTFPLILYHFHRLSWSSLPTNLIILPAQPAVMLIGGLSLLLSFLFFPIGQFFAWVTWPFVAFTIRVVELFASFSWTSQALSDLSPYFVISYFAILAFITFRPRSISFKNISIKPALLTAVLIIASIWLWISYFAAPTGKLEISFLDVGAGEAILIKTPNGRNLLINGGESRLALGEELGRVFSLTNQRLDWLIVAGVSNQQIESWPDSLERYLPAKIAWSGNPNASYSARRIRQTAEKLNIPVSFLLPGQSFDFGAGAQMTLLARTDRGAILLLQFEGFRLLLPIGLDLETIKQLDWGKSIGSLTGLLLTDGADPDSNPQRWLENLQADFLIISADALDRNAYNFESSHILQSSPNLLSTMSNGWIRISTDGNSYQLESER